MFSLRPIPTGIDAAPRTVAVCHKQSFDHLVGQREQRRWHFDAERFRSLEVNHQLIFGRLLDGQVGGFGTPEDFVDVNCRTSV